MPHIPLYQMSPDEEPEDDPNEGLTDEPIDFYVPGDIAFFANYDGRLFGEINLIRRAHAGQRIMRAAAHLTRPHRLFIRKQS